MDGEARPMRRGLETRVNWFVLGLQKIHFWHNKGPAGDVVN